VVLAMWALGALAPAVRAAVPDVAFAPVQLLNAPGATFRVKLADLNRDGKLDVVATTIADSMFVYLGNGDGSFGAPTTYAITSNSSLRNGTQIAIADVTKDGILDVLIARTAENKLSIFPGVGDGTLGTPVVYETPNFPTDLAVGDVYGDGDPDVVLTCLRDNQLFILHTIVNQRFTRSASLPTPEPVQVLIRDFDADGREDLMWMSGADQSSAIAYSLEPKTALDRSTIFRLGFLATGLAAGDLWGTGVPSIAISAYRENQVVVAPRPMVNNSGYRGYETDFSPVPVTFADVNGDGKEDVLAGTVAFRPGRLGTVSLLLSRGDGTLEANRSLTIGDQAEAYEIAAGDLDGDGRKDLVTSTVSYALAVFLQQSSPTITSGDNAQFVTGQNGFFALTASGKPAATFSTSSPLPDGVTLNPNGTLSGTPAAGTARTYPLVITASNGVLPNATQNFTLTVASSLPGLSNLTPENIRSSTISLRGYLDTSGTSPVTRRGFVWSLTSTDSTPQLGEPGVFFVDVPVDTLQGFSAALTGLAPSSDYTYATFAVNSSGTAYAPVSTFQTLAPPGAGSLVVTTDVDEDNGNSDANNGTGTSLREAINYANLLGADATITFSPNLFFSGPATLQVTLGQITLNNVGGTTTINGPGAHLLTINGAANGSQRMLRTVTGYTVINGVTFANGLSSNDGSAIQAGGTVVLNDCVFRNNASPLSRGGALSVSGETRIYRCTFQGNSSGHGGAIAVEGNLLLIQCTLHGNSAVTGDGGALYSPFTANQIRVVHSTFTGNSATGTGGAIFSSGDRLRVFNSILSGNTAPTGPNVQGPLRENVGNLIDADAANIFVTGLPASLGGSTPTIALKPGGLAINAGSNAQSVNWTGVFGQTANPLTTDQRGRPRAIGGTVDVGATELPGLPTVTAPTVSGLTANSAVLGGNVTADGSGPLSLRGIVFARTADNPNPARGALGVTEIIASGNTGIFTVNASGLSATTGYSFAAFAVNEAGAAYSSVATFDTGTVDSDGDMLTDNQEVNLGSNRFSLDSDGDGFNDATEYLNGSDPTSAASVPGTTRTERVFGSGAARGLDLSGNFVYAFNVGPAGAAGQAGDANFTADNAPGITVHGPNNPIANWNNPSFGATAADNVLETVYQSIRWTDRNWSAPDKNLRVDLANLTVGRRYKLQLLFGEAGQTGRRFDVLLNGSLLANDFAPADAQGSASMTTAGSAVVHEFTATSTTLNIVLDGSDVAAVPFLNNDPYLNGATLEALPTAPIANGENLNRPDTTRVAKVLVSTLLGNDSDPDGDSVTLTAVGNALPAGATVELVGNFVLYTAPASNSGNGSFTSP
jgi:CSLREA domain-containing protein